jgi:hypothetical protein
MLHHHLLVRCDVDAVDPVVRDVAVDPLDARPEMLQHAAGFLRDGHELVGRELAGARDIALDDVFQTSRG